MKLKFFLLVLLIILLTHFATAQEDYFVVYKPHQAWFGGLNFGVNSFWGDVNDNTNKFFPMTPFQSSFYKNRHIVIGALFGKRITPYLNVNIETKLGNLSGKDYKSGKEFYSFFNNEIVITTTCDILTLAKVRTNWALYPRVGIGVYGFKTRLWNANTGQQIAIYPDYTVDFKEDANILYKPNIYHYTLAVPFGIGVSYRLLPELNIFFETSMTWVNSDWLDAYHSQMRKFEGVWTTSLGVTYQFDFPVVRVRNVAGAKVYDPALKKDNVDRAYLQKKNHSSVIFKPAKSHTKGAVKHKKAKRKTFSIKNRE